MSAYENLCNQFTQSPRTWLVTGAAGFIGSNLVEELLTLDQKVIGLDNFSTGHYSNLLDVEKRVGKERYKKFFFCEGDIRDAMTCQDICQKVDHVLHQAALGSVPRSIDNPQATHESNVDGFLNMLIAARDAKVKSFVYASSSSVYGDEPTLPKVENIIGKPLSPYAVSKRVGELYAHVFGSLYDMRVFGLRYFNVFGPRQDPKGPYAAVIPKWIGQLLKGEVCTINGDGETSRDFCFIRNVIEANILAACCEKEEAFGKVFNIAVGERTNLNEIYAVLAESISAALGAKPQAPNHGPFRAGDVRHSLADISSAKELLQYDPKFSVRVGLPLVVSWYLENRERRKLAANL